METPQAASTDLGHQAHAAALLSLLGTKLPPIGVSFTESVPAGVPLSPQKGAELQGLVGTMVQLGYLRMEEVTQIPHRAPGSFRAAVYGPLAKLPLAPEVILVRGSAKQLMLVAEAAQMAGLAGALPTMGRPTCAALPLASQSGQLAMSLGCSGTRVYTGLADDEAYVAIPGASLGKLLAQLAGVAAANVELEKFHQARARA